MKGGVIYNYIISYKLKRSSTMEKIRIEAGFGEIEKVLVQTR